MHLVMEVAGGQGYHRRYPVERMYRDVRAGAIMPDSSPASRRTFAEVALGLDAKPVFTLEQGAGHLERVLGSL